MIIQIDFQILCNKIPKAMGIIISFIIPFYVMFIFNIVKDNINYVKIILDFLKQINFHEKFFPLLFFLNWLLLKVILLSLFGLSIWIWIDGSLGFSCLKEGERHLWWSSTLSSQENKEITKSFKLPLR